MPMSDTDGLPRVHPETRAEWRAWLEENHATAKGVWVVRWKKGTGRPVLEWPDIVKEALCFGWIDSTANALDDERHLLRVTPRKKGSPWSRINKGYIEELVADGLMTAVGQAAIDAAKADGSWTSYDNAENLLEPDELVAAFPRHKGSRARWDAFSPSARKGIIWWIDSAKRPETRQKRADETARLAAEGIKANFPQ